ncbi:diguanylate cyclase [Candidatus Gracilibacteria bacterium]|nr:diguanylate cyclase [Candidatus Gracilibacteria bacterium]
MKAFFDSVSDKTTGGILHDLKTTGEVLRAARSKKDVLDFTIRIFLRLGFDRVRIWLVDQENEIYYGSKCSYMSDEKFQKAHIPLKSKMLPKNYMRYLKKKKPYLNTTTPLIKKFFGDHKPPYTVGFPMLSGKQLLGVVSVDNSISLKAINLKETETKIMPFVNHIALVLNRVIADEKIVKANLNLKKKVAEATAELQRRNTELEHFANYDVLSDLPNRRYFEKYLSEEFKKSRQHRPLTLAMLDIDFLKHMNDIKGHEAGDQLIKKIGEILKKDLNITFAARFAGDEFVFLMVNKPHKVHKKIFTTILKKFKKTTKQTVSIGATTYPNPNIKTEIDFVRIADDALYHAKHTGRNRFICADEEGERIMPLTERRLDLQKIEEQGTFAIDYIRQLTAINKISEHLRTSANEKTTLKKIAKSLQKELEFKKVRIYLKGGEDGELKLAAHSQTSNTALVKKIRNPKTLSRFNQQLERVMQRCKVFNLSEHSISPELIKIFGTQKALLVPLVGRKHVIGVIVAEYELDRTFRKSDFDFFLTLGDQIENGIVKARAMNQIENFNRQLQEEITIATKKSREYSHSLENQIATNRKLREKEQRVHFELISALVTSLEEKDIYTRGHSVRVASYAVKLGRQIGIDENQLTNLRYAGLLHDVGKVVIDQSILHKRTALTESEIKELEKHPIIGQKIVSSVRFLKLTALAIRHHHERWDGAGYPDGKKRKQIPLEARILAIADSYDAMVTWRSYGNQMSRAEAIREIETGSGKQFDPELAKIFVRLLKSGRIRTPQSKFPKK